MTTRLMKMTPAQRRAKVSTLRRLREALGLMMGDAAAAYGVTVAAWSAAETGPAERVSHAMFAALATAAESKASAGDKRARMSDRDEAVEILAGTIYNAAIDMPDDLDDFGPSLRWNAVEILSLVTGKSIEALGLTRDDRARDDDYAEWLTRKARRGCKSRAK